MTDPASKTPIKPWLEETIEICKAGDYPPIAWSLEAATLAKQQRLELTALREELERYKSAEMPDLSESVWMIYFEDADRRPEVFSGADAEIGARHRYEQCKVSWSCHLLVAAIDTDRLATYCAKLKVEGEQTRARLAEHKEALLSLAKTNEELHEHYQFELDRANKAEARLAEADRCVKVLRTIIRQILGRHPAGHDAVLEGKRALDAIDAARREDAKE